jgi:hydrogenase expression/formation protein HypE
LPISGAVIAGAVILLYAKIPVMKKILLAHGGGGKETQQLIQEVFKKYLGNTILNQLEDAAVFSSGNGKSAFTTDSFTVYPYFFKGGDIGKLAIAGTVNDLSVMGARPKYLSAGFIIEEGFLYEELEKIVKSMREEAELSNVMVVTGDTKVMPRGDLKGIVINTAGLGEVVYEGLSASGLQVGDKIIVSGTIGDHGACILAEREGIDFELGIESDCGSLWTMLEAVLKLGIEIHAMRDPTRGGLASVLTEWSEQSYVEIEILEEEIPIKDAVRGACELLGMDPTHLASEGRVVIAVKNEDTDAVLNMLRSHPFGNEAKIIGAVISSDHKRVILKSSYNTKRIMKPPIGELLPRIC